MCMCLVNLHLCIYSFVYLKKYILFIYFLPEELKTKSFGFPCEQIKSCLVLFSVYTADVGTFCPRVSSSVNVHLNQGN